MLNRDSKHDFTPDISEYDLRAHAKSVQRKSFNNQRERLQYIRDLVEVDSFDDCLAVSVLASSAPDAGVSESTIYGATDLADLVLRVAHAHADTVATRDLFHAIDVSDTMQERVKIPRMGQSASRVLNGGEITRTEVKSTTVENQRLRSSTVVGSSAHPPLGTMATNLAYVIQKQIEDALSLNEREPAGDLYDAFVAVEEHNYHPDTIIASDIPTDATIPDDGDPSLFGVPVVVSDSIPAGYAVVANSDQFGYEVRFDVMSVSLTEDYKRLPASPKDFPTYKTTALMSTNWAAVEDDAIAVGRLE